MSYDQQKPIRNHYQQPKPEVPYIDMVTGNMDK